MPAIARPLVSKERMEPRIESEPLLEPQCIEPGGSGGYKNQVAAMARHRPRDQHISLPRFHYRVVLHIYDVIWRKKEIANRKHGLMRYANNARIGKAG
jgi:hypothetical protein